MEIVRHKGLALFGICLLSFTAFLDFTIVNTALPFIQQAFKINIFQLQWVANIFPIILSMTMIAVGKLADLWGRKRVFYFGVIAFGVAALCAGFSHEIDVLIFFRGLQGLGASIVFISSTALISETFHSQERARAIGIYGGITGAGLMVGPFFGGVLIGLLDWRWVFWINIPLIIIGLFCCWASLKVPSIINKKLSMDWKGLIFLILGLGFLMYGIIGVNWWCLGIGVIALALLLIFDLKSTSPLLDFSIFKMPLIALSLISCALAGIVSYVFMFFDPLFLKNVLDLTPYSIGLLIAIIPAAQVVISFSFKPLLKWAGLANLLFYSSVSALLAAFLHLFVGVNVYLLYLLLPFALLGVNWGLSNTAMITAVNEKVALHKIGEAIGTIATIWNMVGAIFLALSTVIFHIFEPDFVSGFRSVIAFNMAFMIIVIIAAICIRRKLPAS